MSEVGTVWLVGMMGSGKSTVGRALAERLGVRFVDTDQEIEQRTGRSVARIFEEDGEPAFRALEREAIEACRDGSAVVALGGGAIGQPGAARRLEASGRVVYLRAQVETLLVRVGEGTSRPLLAGLDLEGRRERLSSLLELRRRAYETASLIVDTDGLESDQVVSLLVERLTGGASA